VIRDAGSRTKPSRRKALANVVADDQATGSPDPNAGDGAVDGGDTDDGRQAMS